MSARTSGAAAGVDSCVRSWVRRRFSLEVSRSVSTVLSAEAAAARPGEPLDQRRGGADGGVLTIAGLTGGDGEGTLASLLAAISCSKPLQTSHPHAAQLLWLTGHDGFSHHCSVVEAFGTCGALAVGTGGGGMIAGSVSGRGKADGAGTAD